MNEEMLELYKKHKVNPLGGCFPMLLQIPVFIALYHALFFSIELRGAPFIGWIHDLSVADPYYVTPVLMGASMFLQQKLSPAVADPMQQKIMMILPIVFTFLFMSFPAGLVIYWTVNNVLTIAQQYYIYKIAKDLFFRISLKTLDSLNPIFTNSSLHANCLFWLLILRINFLTFN